MKPQPTPADLLLEALRLYLLSTKPDSMYATPLFRRRHASFGRDVDVELMPDLVLRVRDPITGKVLAQSKPLRIDLLDEDAPDHLEIAWSAWMTARSKRELRERGQDQQAVGSNERGVQS